MNSHIADGKVVKLYLEEGRQVWACKDKQIYPLCDISAFPGCSSFQDAGHQLLLISHPSQFKLVNRVYSSSLKGFIKTPWIAGLPFFYNKKEKGDTLIKEKLFRALDRCENYSLSCGGWHYVSKHDIDSLRVAAINPYIKGNRESLLQALQEHVLYKHASFIDKVDPLVLARFIGKIVDPRAWLVGDTHLSFKHIYRQLGLDLKEATTNKESNLNLKRGWSKGDSDWKNPGSFLSMFSKYTSGAVDFLTNRLFVSYLVFGWLDALSLTHRGRLFAPDVYFKNIVSIKGTLDQIRQHTSKEVLPWDVYASAYNLFTHQKA